MWRRRPAAAAAKPVITAGPAAAEVYPRRGRRDAARSRPVPLPRAAASQTLRGRQDDDDGPGYCQVPCRAGKGGRRGLGRRRGDVARRAPPGPAAAGGKSAFAPRPHARHGDRQPETTTRFTVPGLTWDLTAAIDHVAEVVEQAFVWQATRRRRRRPGPSPARMSSRHEELRRVGSINRAVREPHPRPGDQSRHVRGRGRRGGR